MNVLIIGRTEALYRTAQALAERHRISAIITAPAAPEYSVTEADFRRLAKALKCPFLLTKKLGLDARERIRSARPDIGVSVNWVSVIGGDVLRLVPKGILNCHPGDLPGYRGNATPNWAILRHEKSIPITVHRMEPGELDSGDILAQEHVPLDDSTTVKQIIDAWNAAAPALFCAAVEGLASGRVDARQQALSGRRPFRCYPRLPADSKIDWSTPAREIDALVRASTRPYSGAYSYLKMRDTLKRVYVWKSRRVADSSDDVGVPGHIIRNDPATGESWVFTGEGILAIQVAQYEGEKDFEPGRTWKSVRMGFGVDVEAELIRMDREYRRSKGRAARG